MTSKIVIFSGSSMEDGTSRKVAIPVEVEEEIQDDIPSLRPISHTEGSPSYEEAIDRVLPLANYLLRRVSAIPSKPDNVELTFGIKLCAEAGAFIAKFGSEANFSVKLTWKKPNDSNA